MLASGGEDVLPIVLVDGKLRFSGTWPSRTDLLAPTENACCTPTEQATTGCCAPAEQASAPAAAGSGPCC
jgi:Arsenical resistance operon protein ArsD